MTIHVIKPDRTADLYVGWNLTDHEPAWVGTRAEALADGVEGHRLDRADHKGSSALGQYGAWGWASLYVCPDERGGRRLPRERLGAYALAVFEERDDDAFEMTEEQGDG